MFERDLETRQFQLKVKITHRTMISHARANKRQREFDEALQKGMEYLLSQVRAYEQEFKEELEQAGK